MSDLSKIPELGEWLGVALTSSHPESQAHPKANIFPAEHSRLYVGGLDNLGISKV